MTVSFFDRTTFAVLGLTVKEQLHISGAGFGWLTAAFSIAYLVATPLSGWWIDRVGARRGLVWSVLAWTTIAALHALAPSFAVLFLLRIALGIAEGPSFPGSAQTVHRILPPHERARGFGVLFTGSSIGAMLAPPIASALYAAAGWRVAFLGTALLGLVWIPAWLFSTTRRGVREQLDHGVRTDEAAVRQRVLDVLKQRVMIRAFISIIAVAPIFGLVLGFGALYLKQAFGIEQEDVGHYLWLPPVAFDGAAILFGHLASRQHRSSGEPPRLLFAIGMVLAMTLVSLPWMPTVWCALAALAVAGAGSGIVYTLTTADLLSRVPAGSVSFATGVGAAAQSLALIISSPLIGASVDRFHSFDVAMVALGLWVVPGCVVWLLWRVR